MPSPLAAAAPAGRWRLLPWGSPPAGGRNPAPSGPAYRRGEGRAALGGEDDLLLGQLVADVVVGEVVTPQQQAAGDQQDCGHHQPAGGENGIEGPSAHRRLLGSVLTSLSFSVNGICNAD